MINAHCYWDGILNEKHLLSIKSFHLTQPYSHKITLWTSRNTTIPADYRNLIEGCDCEIRVFDKKREEKDTIFDGVDFFTNTSTWFSDVVRAMLLYKYGGLWFDLDMLFFKDMSCLYDNDFVYKWEDQPYANTAMFFSTSPRGYGITKACENGISKKNFLPWVAFRLSDISSFLTVHPSGYFDRGWDRNLATKIFGGYVSLDYFFRELDDIDMELFEKDQYSYHWHNRWNEPVKDGTIFQRYLERYEIPHNNFQVQVSNTRHRFSM